jgi:hypothetical protein
MVWWPLCGDAEAGAKLNLPWSTRRLELSIHLLIYAEGKQMSKAGWEEERGQILTLHLDDDGGRHRHAAGPV